jgi:hypothetical protein
MRICTPILIALLVLANVAASAQSYRGNWEASGPEIVGRHCPAYDAHITVRGNSIVIRLGGARTYVLKGEVTPDGSFTAEGLNGETSASGKFSGGTMEMSLVARCGVRPGTGHRATPQ